MLQCGMEENPYKAPVEIGAPRKRPGLLIARRLLRGGYVLTLLAVAVAFDWVVTWRPGQGIVGRIVVCASLALVPVTICFPAIAFLLWLLDKRSA
jgi:hypothetical protein